MGPYNLKTKASHFYTCLGWWLAVKLEMLLNYLTARFLNLTLFNMWYKDKLEIYSYCVTILKKWSVWNAIKIKDKKMVNMLGQTHTDSNTFKTVEIPPKKQSMHFRQIDIFLEDYKRRLKVLILVLWPCFLKWYLLQILNNTWKWTLGHWKLKYVHNSGWK